MIKLIQALIAVTCHLARGLRNQLTPDDGKPKLWRLLGSLTPIPLIHLTDCIGDNFTGLRLGFNRFEALPWARIVYEGAVANWEAGKLEIRFLLAVAAGELAWLKSGCEYFLVGNAAPRYTGSDNNVSFPFVYARIVINGAIIHYFGTLGPELSTAIADGRISVNGLWRLDMPHDEAFRSKSLFLAVARALMGMQSVFAERLDLSVVPADNGELTVGSADIFGNVALNRRRSEAPFCNLTIGQEVKFTIDGNADVFTAKWVKSFGSEKGLALFPGSGMTSTEDPNDRLIYLSMNLRSAAKKLGGVSPGTRIHLLN